MELEWIEGRGYKKRILAGEKELGTGNLVQIVRIEPGREVKPHYHVQQTEFYYILGGRALLSIAKGEVEAKAGDVYINQPNDVHSIKNEGRENFELLVFKTGWKEGDIYW